MVLVLCSLYLCYAKCNCAAFNVMDHGYGIWATFFSVQALVLYMSANNMHFSIGTSTEEHYESCFVVLITVALVSRCSQSVV